jgi:hypothetical protein
MNQRRVVLRAMHVIGHQAVGVDSTVKPCGEFAEQFQIGGKVTVIQETGVAIDPPLDDMKRETRQHCTSASWHARTTMFLLHSLTLK